MSNAFARYALLALLPAAALGACQGEDAVPDDAGGEPGAGTNSGGRASGGSPSTGGKVNGGEGGEGGAPDDEMAVKIHFRGQVGDDIFACGKKYKKQGSTNVEVTPQDLRLFISELRLHTQDGEEVPVELDERTPWQSPEVALLDFEDGTGACKTGNSDTNTFITGRVKTGDYTGVTFSTAVPKALNHADPATLPAPLQAGGMTWGWLFGYKFIRAELVATAAPATGMQPGIGLLHLGSTDCDNRPGSEGGAGGEGGAIEPNFGAPPALDCALQNRNEIQLDAFDLLSDVVVVDVGEMMAKVDMSADSQCHSMQMQAACEPLFPSVGVDLMTGDAAPTQTAFRIEAQ